MPVGKKTAGKKKRVVGVVKNAVTGPKGLAAGRLVDYDGIKGQFRAKVTQLVSNTIAEIQRKDNDELVKVLRKDLKFLPKGRPAQKPKAKTITIDLVQDEVEEYQGLKVGDIVEYDDGKRKFLAKVVKVTSDTKAQIIAQTDVDSTFNTGTRVNAYRKYMTRWEEINKQLVRLEKTKIPIDVFTKEFNRALEILDEDKPKKGRGKSKAKIPDKEIAYVGLRVQNLETLDSVINLLYDTMRTHSSQLYFIYNYSQLEGAEVFNVIYDDEFFNNFKVTKQSEILAESVVVAFDKSALEYAFDDFNAYLDMVSHDIINDIYLYEEVSKEQINKEFNRALEILDTMKSKKRPAKKRQGG